MLIKVETFDKRTIYINPEKIIQMSISAKYEHAWRIVMEGDSTEIITATEAQRILPLLTGDTPAPSPAPVEPSHVDDAWWALFNNLVTDIRMGLSPLERIRELKAHVRTYAAPADDTAFAQEVVRLMDDGKMIDAIKALRLIFPGLSLMEYKNFVEAIKKRDLPAPVQEENTDV